MARRVVRDKSRGQIFTAEAVKSFFDDAKLDWQTHHRKPFVVKEHAEAISMNESVYGLLLRGKQRIIITDCLRIARDLEVSVEAVLRIEGYPDLATLINLVDADTTPRYPGEKESILRTLRIALTSPVWQSADWKMVIFKQKADFALASDLDPYTKAAYYADEVHEYSEHLRRNQIQTRAQRKTEEIMAAVS